jgi:tripartite-type tricarboxylate transporter receptor subunit TctC
VLGERMVRERMLTLGADPAGDNPEAFARFIHDDQAKWSRLMKQAGIKLE